MNSEFLFRYRNVSLPSPPGRPPHTSGEPSFWQEEYGHHDSQKTLAAAEVAHCIVLLELSRKTPSHGHQLIARLVVFLVENLAGTNVVAGHDIHSSHDMSCQDRVESLDVGYVAPSAGRAVVRFLPGVATTTTPPATTTSSCLARPVAPRAAWPPHHRRPPAAATTIHKKQQQAQEYPPPYLT